MKQTPLTDYSKRLGAKMAEFAGYDMPIQYEGILAEHKAVRESAGIFDVSHMGHARIFDPSVSRLLSRSLEKVPLGKGAYNLIMKEDGGIIDDAFVYRLGEREWHIVLNASRKEVDVEYLKNAKKLDGIAMLAVQGPKVIGMIGELAPRRGVAVDASVLGVKILLAVRTGYTGEDGFEMIVADASAEKLFERLIDAGMKPCGLGARDLLRLEAALPLYGLEISETIDPYEAGLGFAVELDRDDFIARSALIRRKEAPTRRRVGLTVAKGPVPRHEHEVLSAEGKIVGKVTSGSFSPILGKGIALALVEKNSKPEKIKIRETICNAAEVSLPFYRRKKCLASVEMRLSGCQNKTF